MHTRYATASDPLIPTCPSHTHSVRPSAHTCTRICMHLKACVVCAAVLSAFSAASRRAQPASNCAEATSLSTHCTRLVHSGLVPAMPRSVPLARERGGVTECAHDGSPGVASAASVATAATAVVDAGVRPWRVLASASPSVAWAAGTDPDPDAAVPSATTAPPVAPPAPATMAPASIGMAGTTAEAQGRSVLLATMALATTTPPCPLPPPSSSSRFRLPDASDFSRRSALRLIEFVAVLDRVLRPPREAPGNLRPFRPHLVHRLLDQPILVRRPLALFDVGAEVIVPALAALFARTPVLHDGRNQRPSLRPKLCDGLEEELVLLVAPRPLGAGGGGRGGGDRGGSRCRPRPPRRQQHPRCRPRPNPTRPPSPLARRRGGPPPARPRPPARLSLRRRAPWAQQSPHGAPPRRRPSLLPPQLQPRRRPCSTPLLAWARREVCAEGFRDSVTRDCPVGLSVEGGDGRMGAARQSRYACHMQCNATGIL